MFGKVEEIRPRGRPKKRWLDSIRDNCERMDLTIVEANIIVRERNG